MLLTNLLICTGLYFASRALLDREPEEPDGPEADGSDSGAPGDPAAHAGARVLDAIASGLDEIAERSREGLMQVVPYFGEGGRREEIDAILERPERSTRGRAERMADRSLVVAVGAFGASLLGRLVFPPLMLLGVAGIMYRVTAATRVVQEQWRADKKLGFALLFILFQLGLLFAGQVVIGTAFLALYALVDKLVAVIYDDSSASLVEVLSEAPREVWIAVDGVQVKVPFASLQPGDRLIVQAGELISADGVVLDGELLVDTHALTGESRSMERRPGERVHAGTFVSAGQGTVEVERAGDETVAARIGQVLRSTTSYHSSTQLLCEEIADRSVLPTLGVFGVTLGLLGPAAAAAAITCSIGIQMRVTGPMSTLSYLHIATRDGILVKDGRALEGARAAEIVVFDKTGTLTEDRLELCQIHPAEGVEEQTVLRYAAAAEHRQTHPIARSILEAVAARELELWTPEDARCERGLGVAVTVDAAQVLVGSARYMARMEVQLPEGRLPETAREIHERGHALVYVAVSGVLIGLLEFEVPVRPEAAGVVAALQARGKEVYILSGDHEAPTAALAKALGVDGHFAGVLPEEKGDVIETLQQGGKPVCFVGDGINDAIALKRASVSISMRGATSIAQDAAQVILREPDLRLVVRLLSLSEDFWDTTKVNVAMSTVPGVVNLGAVYLLGTGVFVAAGLTWFGLGAGLAASLVPRLSFEERRDEGLDEAPPRAR